MTGAPDERTRHPAWYNGLKWNMSKPFTVEWIVTENIEDRHVSYLRNNLNDGLPITRARDCTEVDEINAYRMVAIMDIQAEQIRSFT